MEISYSQIKEKDNADAPEVDSNIIIVVPGEVITTEQGFLKGHGVYVENDKMIASVCGVVERVNKLISVRPLKTRYVPQIGDVVVGRVTDLNAKSWKMDIGAYQDATLSINSIILPGGEHRRRTDEDILQMRNIFVEHDLISAEIQQVDKRGSVALHTRSPKYGKLENGVLVIVPSALVKRLKQHFITLECDVGCILGYNGYIWVTEKSDDRDYTELNNTSTVDSDRKKKEFSEKVIGPATRHRISRVVDSIQYLKNNWKLISPDSIMMTYKMLLKQQSV